MDARIKSGHDECVGVHTDLKFKQPVFPRHSFAISPRIRASFIGTSRPQRTKGAGNAGRSMRPQPRV
jgi:hypothetical protein